MTKIIPFPKRQTTAPASVVFHGLPLSKDEWAFVVMNDNPLATLDDIDSSWDEVVDLFRQGRLPDQAVADNVVSFPGTRRDPPTKVRKTA